ncbi:MAG: outer-membrane lipoprotein carrier protein LolA [Pseudomonadota bacterium]
MTLIFMLLSAVHAAAAPVDDLLSTLASIESLSGRFSQTQFGPDDSDAVQQSDGRFRLLKGGYFSWEITSPDRQMIVATPQYLWHHDLDLETVTRRPVALSEELSPLQVLGGDTSYLRDSFTIESAGEGGYRLLPRATDPGFRALTLGFEQGQLAWMDIVDRLGQRIQLRFFELDSRAELSAADFDFQPPPGVDLFYYDE